MSIIDQFSDGKYPFAVCLISIDCTTTSGIAHRVLEDNGHSDILLRYMEDALQRHHISPEALQRHMDLIAPLKIKNLPIPRSPYPQTLTTQKGKSIPLAGDMLYNRVCYGRRSIREVEK